MENGIESFKWNGGMATKDRVEILAAHCEKDPTNRDKQREKECGKEDPLRAPDINELFLIFAPIDRHLSPLYSN